MDASTQTDLEDMGDRVLEDVPGMGLDTSHGADSSIQETDLLNNSETPVDSLRHQTLLLDHFRKELIGLKDIFGELERSILDGRLPLYTRHAHEPSTAKDHQGAAGNTNRRGRGRRGGQSSAERRHVPGCRYTVGLPRR